MRCHNKISTFVIVASLWSCTGCKNDPINPSEPLKSPPEYTWTVDTLAYPGSLQTLMYDIWGSASNNLYIVGHNDQNIGIMFRFDGKNWSEVKLNISQGGNILQGMTLQSICGFEPNDIWAVGYRAHNNPNPPPNFLNGSVIIHFDGTAWREIDLTSVGTPPVNAGLEAIWGSSSNDIWAGGWYGVLYHFDGSGWTKEPLPLSSLSKPRQFFTIRAISGSSPNNAYMTAYRHDFVSLRETTYFFELLAGQWALVDSLIVPSILSGLKWGDVELWQAPWGTLYSVGYGGIFRGQGAKQEWWIIGGSTKIDIFGTNENNLIAVGDDGKGLYLDSQHFQQLDAINYNNVLYTGVWMDERNAFIIGTTNGVTLVLHGK